ncbi:hypothetical protein QBC39DRAFT_162835 [Podospora conica]|nr:hypothetical protein QBC39DRAFT_162835 [Schizothecium conicum]
MRPAFSRTLWTGAVAALAAWRWVANQTQHIIHTDQPGLESHICQIYHDFLSVVTPPTVPTVYEAFGISPGLDAVRIWEAVSSKLDPSSPLMEGGHRASAGGRLEQGGLTENEVWMQMGHILLGTKFKSVYDASFQKVLAGTAKPERRQVMQKMCRWMS